MEEWEGPSSEDSLIFDSNFEGGNLLAVYRVELAINRWERSMIWCCKMILTLGATLNGLTSR
jgi:hypothetical protein